MMIGHLVDLMWTGDVQVELQTTVERYTSQGTWGACRVGGWWVVHSLSLSENLHNSNQVSEQWFTEWPLDTSVDCPIFTWLWEVLQPLLFDEPAKYVELNQCVELSETLLHKHKRNYIALTCSPPLQRQCNFVLFQAIFVISSGSSQRI